MSLFDRWGVFPSSFLMAIQPTDNRTKKTVVWRCEIFRGNSSRERTRQDVSCPYARSATREKSVTGVITQKTLIRASRSTRHAQNSSATRASHKGHDHITAVGGSRTRNQDRSKLGASAGEAFMHQKEVTCLRRRRDSAHNERPPCITARVEIARAPAIRRRSPTAGP